MILLGLLLLAAAVIIAVVGVLSNIGSSHLLTRSFERSGTPRKSWESRV